MTTATTEMWRAVVEIDNLTAALAAEREKTARLLEACKIAQTFICDGELPIDPPQSVASILYAAIEYASR